MGMNYYWKELDGPRCEHCGRYDTAAEIHIGKSSVGWAFALHVTPGIKSLDDWIHLWNTLNGIIEDELGREVTKEEMLKVITERPEDLRRHEDDTYGGPTWDLVEGEFS